VFCKVIHVIRQSLMFNVRNAGRCNVERSRWTNGVNESETRKYHKTFPSFGEKPIHKKIIHAPDRVKSKIHLFPSGQAFFGRSQNRLLRFGNGPSIKYLFFYYVIQRLNARPCSVYINRRVFKVNNWFRSLSNTILRPDPTHALRSSYAPGNMPMTVTDTMPTERGRLRTNKQNCFFFVFQKKLP